MSDNNYAIKIKNSNNKLEILFKFTSANFTQNLTAEIKSETKMIYHKYKKIILFKNIANTRKNVMYR